ncbi:sialic acid-binding Ig-like lectin 11 isoform X2 [Castor canadensis]|uniref:Sialic acid-binding Ig-like lectin 11 isoform X2 n=1 Tax=Castor canadensis TaxID=51338 RepID=A0AC58LAC1_CASCN
MQLLGLLLALLGAGEWDGGWGRQVRAGAVTEPLQPSKSPQKHPRLHIQVQEAVMIQEGLCALVPCVILYSRSVWNHSAPAYGYWYWKKKNVNKQEELVATNDPDREADVTKSPFQLVGDPRANDCSLGISEPRKENSGRYFFRLERESEKLASKSSLLNLTITGLTQLPDIHIPEPLESGRLSLLKCSMPGACKGDLSPTFSWTGASLRSLGLDLEAYTTSEIKVTPLPQDHGTYLTCRVTLPKIGVSTERTVQLNVSFLESQGNVTFLEAQKGQVLQLLCTAEGQPPVTLSWALENRVLSRSHPTGSRTLGLELPGVKPGDAGHYTCRAENRLGSQDRTLDLSVQYPPEELTVTVSQANRTELEILRNGSSLPVLQGQSLRLVCVTHSNPPARLSWVQGTKTLSLSRSSDPGVLELPVVQEEHEGELTCQAQNLLGTQHFSLSLSVHYPPQLLGPFCSWGAEGLTCSCSSRARPPPSLCWWMGEALLDGDSSNASFMVTSSSAGTWANSSLILHGGVSSGLRLSCEARNVHRVQRATVLLLPGKAELGTSPLLLVMGGAGVATLLCFCAGLIFFRMKSRRQAHMMDAARSAAARKAACVPGPICMQGHRNTSGSDSPPEAPPPARAPPPAVEELELHYASLSFRGLRPREAQDPEDAHATEYAELKIRK